MKIVTRVIAGSSLIIACTLVAVLALLLYPSNLFAKRISYREFTLHASQPLDDGYTAVLDHARELARISELYDSTYTYDIFLTNGSYYKNIQFMVLKRAMARSLDNNILLNVAVDFKNNRLYSETNWRNLTQTIAHEMIHCLQLNTYGIKKFNTVIHPPYWKLEGYPEYIALQDILRDPEYNFLETIKKLEQNVTNNIQWIEYETGRTDNITYFKGRVMIEYLIGVQGMTYDQILCDTRSEDEVYQELLAWSNKAHSKE